MRIAEDRPAAADAGENFHVSPGRAFCQSHGGQPDEPLLLKLASANPLASWRTAAFVVAPPLARRRLDTADAPRPTDFTHPRPRARPRRQARHERLGASADARSKRARLRPHWRLGLGEHELGGERRVRAPSRVTAGHVGAARAPGRERGLARAQVAGRCQRTLTLDLRPWPRINGSIRALDESPLGVRRGYRGGVLRHQCRPSLEAAPANVATGDELKPGLVAEMFVIEDETPLIDDAWFTRTPLFRRIDAQINYARSATFRRHRAGEPLRGVLGGASRGQATESMGCLSSTTMACASRLIARRCCCSEDIMSGLSPTTSSSVRATMSLLVEFTEGSGEQTCVFSWTPPGRSEEVVPASAFLHARRHLQPATVPQNRDSNGSTDSKGGFSLMTIRIALGAIALPRRRWLAGTGGCRSTEDSFRAKETSRARSTFSLSTRATGEPTRRSMVCRRTTFGASSLPGDGAAWFATGRGCGALRWTAISICQPRGRTAR